MQPEGPLAKVEVDRKPGHTLAVDQLVYLWIFKYVRGPAGELNALLRPSGHLITAFYRRGQDAPAPPIIYIITMIFPALISSASFSSKYATMDALACIFHIPPSASNSPTLPSSSSRRMNSLSGCSTSRKVR